ncbi:AAA family ATPase [Apilactobacillus sp. TMW 2.2459]|uniref:guanylate kinase n=1 Tax=Apilactobacillus xinyiensis TaxID=2841032 RepID=UPI00200D3DCA|nr:AAA family ATPase [Apilactobacillus xinyiensis]MCL0311988.1 AAA family ATPase [Apilactobacillus xinyiensis]
MSNKVIVVTGAAGSGKTTVRNYLAKHFNMTKVITHTTREPRYNERDGVDYYFESDSTFANKHYLESVEYSGAKYGSSYEGLQLAWDKSAEAVIVLDTKGAITYKRKLGKQAIIIFLQVNNVEMLKHRMVKRGDSMRKIIQRINSLEYKRDQQLPAELNGAIVINNDNWDVTKQKLNQIFDK